MLIILRINAIQLVSQDAWFLALWLHHHARLFGLENLFLILHNPSGRVRALAEGHQHIILKDTQGDFDARRMQLINGIANGLLNYCDAVVHFDLDELLALDTVNGPESFKELLQEMPQSVGIFATGVEPFEMTEDAPLDTNKALLAQRPNAVFNRKYSKPVLRTAPGVSSLHFVPVKPRELFSFEFLMPRHLYLFHLKYFDVGLTQQMNERRIEFIKTLSDDEQHGDFMYWATAGRRTRLFVERYAQREEQPYETAYNIAFASMSKKPIRERSKLQVRPGFAPHDIRFKLQEHLQSLIHWPSGLLAPQEYSYE